MAKNPPSEPFLDEDGMQGPLPMGGDLEPPVLLIAMPQVLDPFFNMSVVLLVEHRDEGSLGFIVNRPTGVPVFDILEGLEIPWHGEEEAKAHFGGPVQPQLGTVIYRSEGAPPAADDDDPEIYPGVTLTQNVKELQSLAEAPPGKLRLYLGYAGWGPGQLMTEIQRNDWLMAPVSDDLVFTDDPAETWRAALRSVGVDPAQLPSWTDSDAPAN